MNKFLFYDNIENYLTEEERRGIQEKPKVEASIQARWIPKINPKYRQGSNEPKKINKRILNVGFYNVPAEIVDVLDKELGVKPNAEYPSEDKKTYNIVYNCNDIYSESETAAKKARMAFKIFNQYGYKLPDIDTLMTNIREYDKAEEESNEKWIELVQELGNAETNEMVNRFVKMYSKIYQEVYGHKLSWDTVRMILSQKPDATLVFTEYEWLHTFNCRVNPGAQKIYYLAPYSNRRQIEGDYDLLKKYADSHGITFNRDKEFTGHATYGISLKAAKTVNMLCIAVGYDQSEVTPIESEDDWRQTKYGMVNNMTGEPNELTADFLNTLQPNDENAEEYKKLKELISDNAKFYYAILTSQLMRKDAKLGQYFGALGNENKNPDYTALLPKVLKKIVDGMLEDEYKIKKPADRVASRDRITGEILFLCGVWDGTALSAVKGGTIDRATAVHDSNIVNEILKFLDTKRNATIAKLKSAIKDLPKDNTPKQKTGRAVNESLEENITLCTPEKFIKDLGLKVVGAGEMNDEDFEYWNKENQKQVNNLMERIDKVLKDNKQWM